MSLLTISVNGSVHYNMQSGYTCCAMACEQTEKTVLVRFCERSRPITFTSGGSDSESDSDLVLKQFLRTFDDQITKSAAQRNELFLQIKEEEWGGEFVDVSREQVIPDRSVLKVLVEKSEKKVSTTGFSIVLCRCIF